MYRLAVYGSLKRGFHNNRFLQNAEFVKQEDIEIPFKMVSLGAFPGLVPIEDTNKIRFEIYNVDEPTYKAVERLEGYPNFYNKAVIPTSEGDAEIYILEGDIYKNKKPVTTGIWEG